MAGPIAPGRDCPYCPRLVAFRKANRAEHPDWFNAPVPTFGALDARLLIVGLAPGLRGANRTGRPFTGDYAGDLLYATLLNLGLAQGTYGQSRNDGLKLAGCAITNAVRCVPPQNKPLPEEITRCRSFLTATIAAMPNLVAILALGRIAHDSVVRALGGKLSAHAFAHGKQHRLAAGAHTLSLFDSYHCSRYNTNTGVLTADMFTALFREVRAYLDAAPPIPA
ncbi:MAG: uracil-DNA glycosylase [Methylovirgula sp.]|nr:uracil-DNA glycosylase [Methylovirgula sp.]